MIYFFSCQSHNFVSRSRSLMYDKTLKEIGVNVSKL